MNKDKRITDLEEQLTQWEALDRIGAKKWVNFVRGLKPQMEIRIKELEAEVEKLKHYLNEHGGWEGIATPVEAEMLNTHRKHEEILESKLAKAVEAFEVIKKDGYLDHSNPPKWTPTSPAIMAKQTLKELQ